MKVLLVNFAAEKTIQVIDIEPSLDEYYKHLDCSLVDIKSIGEDYDVIFDDEFLHKLDGLELDEIGRTDFVNGLNILGPFIVCKADDQGNEVDVGDIQQACFYLGTQLASAGIMRRRRQ